MKEKITRIPSLKKKKKEKKKNHKIASGELLYNIRSSAGCSVMTDSVDSGCAWRLKKRIYVSSQLIHVTERKRMQHCKAILLQLKFFEKKQTENEKKKT